jgi:hypothetical protein
MNPRVARQLAVGRPAAPGRRPRRLDVRDPPGQAGPRRGAAPAPVSRHRGGAAPRHGSHGGGRAIADPANRRWVAQGAPVQDPGHAFTSSSAALPAFLAPSPACPVDLQGVAGQVGQLHPPCLHRVQLGRIAGQRLHHQPGPLAAQPRLHQATAVRRVTDNQSSTVAVSVYSRRCRRRCRNPSTRPLAGTGWSCR